MPVAAQTGPTPTPTPPSGFPPPVVITLPPPGGALAAEPSPLPLPTPTPTRASPTPRATPTPRVAPTPASRATATPSATPTPVASPPPAVPAAPTPLPVPATTPVLPEPSGPPVVSRDVPASGAAGVGAGWLLPVAAVAVAVLLLAALLFLRRHRSGAEAPAPEAAPPAAAPAPVPDEAPAPAAAPAMLARPAPAPVAPAAGEPRAWLAFTLRPRRAGLNLLTATLDAEIRVRNEGDAAAEDIRLDLALLSARAGQEAELGERFAAPVLRPAVPPFALAPGEERTVTALATLPRGAINVLGLEGREMFVPVAAVNLRYATAGTSAQTAQAFAIGIERAGAAKLAPFRLDAPRMHEAVAARPHALALRS